MGSEMCIRDRDEEIHIKLEGEIADLLIRRDPSYKEFATQEKGKTVIFTKLDRNKAV